MIRRPPRSTRTDTSFPTRRSSDLNLEFPAAYGELVRRRSKTHPFALAAYLHQHPYLVRGHGDVCPQRFSRWLSRSTISSSRSEEHTSELQSLMRISYAVFCLKKKKQQRHIHKQQ